MALLTFVSSFDDVVQIEAVDDVQGGPGAIANEHAQRLGNRTEYLRDIVAPDSTLISIVPTTFDFSGGSTPVLQFTGTNGQFTIPLFSSIAQRQLLTIQHKGKGYLDIKGDNGGTDMIRDTGAYGIVNIVRIYPQEEVTLIKRAGSLAWDIQSKSGGAISSPFSNTGITFAGSGANGGGTAYDFTYKVVGNEVVLSGSVTVNTTGLLEHIVSFPADATPSKTVNITPATIAPTGTTYFFCKIDVSGHMSLGASALFAGTLYFDGLRFRLY